MHIVVFAFACLDRVNVGGWVEGGRANSGEDGTGLGVGCGLVIFVCGEPWLVDSIFVKTLRILVLSCRVKLVISVQAAVLFFWCCLFVNCGSFCVFSYKLSQILFFSFQVLLCFTDEVMSNGIFAQPTLCFLSYEFFLGRK